jgi:hypothetical protein
MGLFYVVFAPILMSVLALLGSDPFARLWGPVAIILGAIAYVIDYAFRGRQDVKTKSNAFSE